MRPPVRSVCGGPAVGPRGGDRGDRRRRGGAVGVAPELPGWARPGSGDRWRRTGSGPRPPTGTACEGRGDGFGRCRFWCRLARGGTAGRRGQGHRRRRGRREGARGEGDAAGRRARGHLGAGRGQGRIARGALPDACGRGRGEGGPRAGGDGMAQLGLAVLDLADEPPIAPPPAGLWPARRLPAATTVPARAMPGGPASRRTWQPADLGPVDENGLASLRGPDSGHRRGAGRAGAPVCDPATGLVVGVVVVEDTTGRRGERRPEHVATLAALRRAGLALPRPWLMAGESPRPHFTQRAQGQRNAARGGDVFQGRDEALPRAASMDLARRAARDAVGDHGAARRRQVGGAGPPRCWRPRRSATSTASGSTPGRRRSTSSSRPSPRRAACPRPAHGGSSPRSWRRCGRRRPS